MPSIEDNRKAYNKWKVDENKAKFSAHKDGSNWVIEIYDGADAAKTLDQLSKKLLKPIKALGTFSGTDFEIQIKRGAFKDIQVRDALKMELGRASIKCETSPNAVSEDEDSASGARTAPVNSPPQRTVDDSGLDDMTDLLDEPVEAQATEDLDDVDALDEVDILDVLEQEQATLAGLTEDLDLLDDLEPPQASTERVSFVKLQQARLVWLAGTQKVEGILAEIAKQILTDFPEETEIAKKIESTLQDSFSEMEVDLLETLDEILNLQGANKDTGAKLAQARKELQTLGAWVARSPLLAHLDENPYGNKIAPALTEAVKQMQTHLEGRAGGGR